MDAKTEYLNPLFERFGAHQGLNADWCTMAWNVRGDLWILDDESPEETVSLVRRVERDDETEIVEIVTGSVDRVFDVLLQEGN